LAQENKVLSAYLVRKALETMKNKIKPNLMKKIVKVVELFGIGNMSVTVAKILETLYPMDNAQSANKNLNRMITDFNECAQNMGVRIQCCITKEKKGGALNRFVWFEGYIATPASPIFDDLASVKNISDAYAIKINKQCIVLFTYWNENERDAVLEEFGCKRERAQEESGLCRWDLGICGKYRVLLVHVSEQGYLAGFKTAIKANEVFNPYAIISVGIGWGAKDEGEEIGDVMVPRVIVNANSERISSTGKTTLREGNLLTSKNLNDAVHNQNDVNKGNSAWPKVITWGTLISKDIHVNNKAVRNRMVKKYAPDAVGGDMESAGLGLAAHECGNAFLWLCVKGISDFADGRIYEQDRDQRQKLAATNAAIVAKHLIESLPLHPQMPETHIDSPAKKRHQLPEQILPDLAKSKHIIGNRGKNISLNSFEPYKQGSGIDLFENDADSTANDLGTILQIEMQKWANDKDGPPLFALLGEYGMGKTINCQLFAKEQRVRSLDAVQQRRSVLYFDLRHVTELQKGVPTLDSVIEECAERGWLPDENGSKITRAEIYEHIYSGDIPIFDGLDEVLVKLNQTDGAVFVRNLLSIINTAEDNGVVSPKVIISTRTQYFRTLREQNSFLTGHERGNKRADSYAAMLLLPFNEDQVREYLSNVLKEDDIEKTMSMLESTYDLRSLTRRPYTLSLIREMMPIIQRWAMSGKQISAAELYREITFRWLERDNTKHYLTVEHKRMFAEQLAARLWRKKATAIPVLELEDWSLEWIESQPALQRRYSVAKDDADKLLEDIRNSTYLARVDKSDSDGRFRFSHTSIQEYFVAEHLLDAVKADRIADWDLPLPSAEIFDFLGQLLADEDERNALLGVMSRWICGDSTAVNVNLLNYALRGKQKGFSIPSLYGANFAGADLRDMEFELDMPNVSFMGAVLRDAFFKNCDLRNADFNSADMTRTKIHNSNLNGAKIGGADFSGAELYETEAAVTGMPITYRTRFLWCNRLSDELKRDSNCFINTPVWNKEPGGKAMQLRSFVFKLDTRNLIAWSCDNRRIAVSLDNNIGILDVISGECFALFQGHEDDIASVSWSPDGKSIVSGSLDSTILIWDAATGQCLTYLKGHKNEVYSVAWSPDGKSIVSSGLDSTIRIWDAATGQCRTNLKSHKGGVTSVSWSPDGKSIVSGGGRDNTIRIWDAATGQCRAILKGHEGGVSSVSWSPDGKSIVSSGWDSSIRVWNAATGQCRANLKVHNGGVTSVSWSPDGKSIASSGGRDSVIRIWDAATGQCRANLKGHNGGVTSVSWSPDGKSIASSGGRDSTIRIWDAATGQCRANLKGHEDDVTSVSWSPDGKSIVSGGLDRAIRIWDAATGQCRATLKGHEWEITSVSWSPDGNSIASSGSLDSTICIWDAATGQCRANLKGNKNDVTAVSWSPDGKSIVSGSDDRTIRIWDAATGQCQAILKGHEDDVNSVSWSPDGKSIVSGSDDNTLRIWDAATGQCQAILKGHEDDVNSVSWSPDGKSIVSGSRDNTIRIWDAATGQCRTYLKGHKWGVTSVSWSPDGKSIVSGSLDSTIRIWDAATGQCQTYLNGHKNEVFSVSWSPDGKSIVSGGRDSTIRIWDAATGQCQIILEKFFPDDYAVWNGDGTLRFASKMAWQYLGWQTMINNKLERLPAEMFGRLPGFKEYVKPKQHW